MHEMCFADFNLDDLTSARHSCMSSSLLIHPMLIREFVEEQTKCVAA